MVFDGAAVSDLGDGRVRRAPLEADRLAVAIPDGEADALVDGIGEKIDDAPAARVEVNLDDVALGVAEEAGLVALIGSGIVEACFGEAKNRLDPGLASGSTSDQRTGNGASERERPSARAELRHRQ